MFVGDFAVVEEVHHEGYVEGGAVEGECEGGGLDRARVPALGVELEGGGCDVDTVGAALIREVCEGRAGSAADIENASWAWGGVALNLLIEQGTETAVPPVRVLDPVHCFVFLLLQGATLAPRWGLGKKRTTTLRCCFLSIVLNVGRFRVAHRDEDEEDGGNCHRGCEE